MPEAFKSITSLNNDAVKEAARLKRKRHRYERRRLMTEGEDLLDAALQGGVVPRQVFVLEGHEGEVEGWLEVAAATQEEGARLHPAEIFACSPAVMNKLSELGSSSRVIAIFDFLNHSFPEGLGGSLKRPLLYLAGVRDPGNVGALIRSAAALGAAGVALGPDTADIYSPKALRGAMGAIFQTPVFIDVAAGEIISWSRSIDAKIIGTDSHAGKAPWDLILAGGFVLVMGSEREGVSQAFAAAAAEMLRIPQTQDAESLNVAMAGTVILYEALKQQSAAV